MKKKIREVHDYFADKLTRGLYKVVKIHEHTVHVIVDNEWPFTIWTANAWTSFGIWNSSDNLMNLEFTDEQKATGFKIIQALRKGWVDTEKRDREILELKKLQEKYPDGK